MKTLFLLAALVVGGWGQQAKWEFKAGRRLLWDGTILDLTKTPITTDMQSSGGMSEPITFPSDGPLIGTPESNPTWAIIPIDVSVKSAFVYDLPAVKKTRKVSTCMVMEEDCLRWSESTATETYYTCIDKSLPPGLALVVSEDLTRGWCTGPRLKP